MATSSLGLTSSGLLQALQQANGGSALSADGTRIARKKLQGGTNSTNTAALEPRTGASPLDKLFSVVDSDSNGSVSKTELSSFLDTLRSRSDLLQVQEQSQQTQLPSASDILTSADTDGDGALSLAEFKANLTAQAPAGAGGSSDSEDKKHYSRFDTNKDGVVSEAELAAVFGSKASASASATSATSSSSPDLLGLLTQAISAYSSTSNTTNSASNTSALNLLLKAA